MRIVIIVLTLLWFFFGAKIASNKFCPETSAATETSTGAIGATDSDCSLILKDKDGGLEISSAENFQFLKSSADVMGTTSEMAETLGALTTYLNTNSNRFMEITGLYMEAEENITDKDNLGKARAISVKSYLMSKGIDGKQLTTNGMLDNNICASDDKILSGVKVAFSEIPSN